MASVGNSNNISEYWAQGVGATDPTGTPFIALANEYSSKYESLLTTADYDEIASYDGDLKGRINLTCNKIADKRLFEAFKKYVPEDLPPTVSDNPKREDMLARMKVWLANPDQIRRLPEIVQEARANKEYEFAYAIFQAMMAIKSSN